MCTSRTSSFVGEEHQQRQAAATAGREAATNAAIDYSILYGSGSAIDVAKNSDQISQSGDWRAFGLIAGYNTFAAVQAGFGSDFTEGKFGKGMFGGVLSDGIGGGIHDAGNALLQGYDPIRGNSWYRDKVPDLGFEALAGFGKGVGGKIVGNSFDKLGDSFKDKAFGTYALMLPKQIAGMFGGQMSANFIKRIKANQDFDSSDNWEGIGASWGRDYWKFLKSH